MTNTEDVMNSKRIKVFVVGHRGMSGSDQMQALVQTSKYIVIGVDLDEVDITDRKQTIQALNAIAPNIVIDTGGLY